MFLFVRENDAVRYRLTSNQLLTTHALQRDTLVGTHRYDLFFNRTAGAIKSKIQGVNLWLTLENLMWMEKAADVAGPLNQPSDSELVLKCRDYLLWQDSLGFGLFVE